MFSFACLENTCCYISSEYADLRLSCNPEGLAITNKNRQESEEWSFESSEDDFVFLKNIRHGRYLVMQQNRTLITSDNKNVNGSKWIIKPSPESHGSFWLESKDYRLVLACNHGGYLFGFNEIDAVVAIWKLEFKSGELLFLSSFPFDKRVKCEPSGDLSMTENWKGWEVWRFIELGDGDIRISSWVHKTKYLCCNPEGHVYTSENPHESWGKWKVEKKSSQNGVTIQSVKHKSFLWFNNHRLCTTKDHDSDNQLWCLEPANSQTYFISSLSHDKRIGTYQEKPFSTNNRSASEQWKINRIDSDLFTIQSLTHSNYLGVKKSSQLFRWPSYDVDVVKDAKLWKLEPSRNGGFFIVSNEHKCYLACNEEYKLYISHEKNICETSWVLEPCMPKVITGSQISALKKAAVGAVALAVATPFAITGIIGALGFTSSGIVAGSTAAGMMSAEAIAAGGGVMAGGTVATLQSIGAVGLGASLTSAAVTTGALIGAGGVGIVSAVTREEIKNIGTTNANNVYFISSLSHDKRIGASQDGLFSTNNRSSSEQWKINRVDSDQYTIQSLSHGCYLGSKADGGIYVVRVANDTEVWKLECSDHGAFLIVSKKHERSLACNEEYNLYTSHKSANDREAWALEPCNPMMLVKRPFCDWRSW